MQFLDRVYADSDVLSREDLYRGMLAADAPVEVVVAMYLLPEGTYRRADIPASVIATPEAA